MSKGSKAALSIHNTTLSLIYKPCAAVAPSSALGSSVTQGKRFPLQSTPPRRLELIWIYVTRHLDASLRSKRCLQHLSITLHHNSNDHTRAYISTYTYIRDIHVHINKHIQVHRHVDRPIHKHRYTHSRTQRHTHKHPHAHRRPK